MSIDSKSFFESTGHNLVTRTQRVSNGVWFLQSLLADNPRRELDNAEFAGLEAILEGLQHSLDVAVDEYRGDEALASEKRKLQAV
ncbi:hypothetical protein GEOBRER4_n1650 [Citrifermentans bremense]|uniref:Uncharacterized protein n=1 Tax=Citrifermentans bremense TaxID=60035 RepID=A0A6S6LXP3_9BACT|nr:hypothetical protein [Citrifermentans bremense]BCG46837.1 hypothetical protein GEOBRER4_n1650 [Citrifermentans bremense]